MSYTKTTWHTGDVVTSAKLNNAESGIENAQWKTESSTQLFSESVTTTAAQYGNMGAITYASPITADTIVVTLNGTDYSCNKIVSGSSLPAYGGMGQAGPDFTDYPFLIMYMNESYYLFTETAGAYTISVSAATVTPSETWTSVVASATSLVIMTHAGDSGLVLDKTWQEIHDAFASGKNCPVIDNLYIRNVLEVSSSVGYYYVRVYTTVSPFYIDYTTDSADGYPTYTSGG